MKQTEEPPPDTAKQAQEQEPTGNLAVVEASSLFGGAREIGIRHEGSLYRLKITRQGKLILNK